MKCELCQQAITYLDSWVPVFQYDESPFEQEVWPYRKGIHLECVKVCYPKQEAPSTENEKEN